MVLAAPVPSMVIRLVTSGSELPASVMGVIETAVEGDGVRPGKRVGEVDRTAQGAVVRRRRAAFNVFVMVRSTTKS